MYKTRLLEFSILLIVGSKFWANFPRVVNPKIYAYLGLSYTYVFVGDNQVADPEIS